MNNGTNPHGQAFVVTLDEQKKLQTSLVTKLFTAYTMESMLGNICLHIQQV